MLNVNRFRQDSADQQYAIGAMSRREETLLRGAVEIATRPPKLDDVQFMHSIMCQVGLPRSAVAGRSFERQCGGVALKVCAGELWDGERFVEQMVPYGAWPRLILGWINKYALSHNTAEIFIGENAADFMRMLGKVPSGGKRGSFSPFKRQITALASCRMILGFNSGGVAYTFNGQPVEQFEAWLHDTGDRKRQWPRTIKLSESYFSTLKGHAIPFDVRALSLLSGSSLEMDIYVMLAERLHRIKKPVKLYWANLKEQFGQEYQGANQGKDFKNQFLRHLKKVLLVYPDANVQVVKFGVVLKASPPPIPYRG